MSDWRDVLEEQLRELELEADIRGWLHEKAMKGEYPTAKETLAWLDSRPLTEDEQAKAAEHARRKEAEREAIELVREMGSLGMWSTRLDTEVISDYYMRARDIASRLKP